MQVHLCIAVAGRCRVQHVISVQFGNLKQSETTASQSTMRIEELGRQV